MKEPKALTDAREFFQAACDRFGREPTEEAWREMHELGRVLDLLERSWAGGAEHRAAALGR